MKTFIKILIVLVAIILAALIITPIVYKAEITELAKKELNKQVNAKIDFADMNLGLIKSFPNFNLEIGDFSIVGMDEFYNDTLCNIDAINIKIALFSVLKGDAYKIKSIGLNKPVINIKVLENAKANYNIALPDTVVTKTASTEDDGNIKFAIDKFSITDGVINYADESMQMEMHLKGINHKLSGELSADRATITSSTRAEEFNLIYDGIKYFNKVAAVYNSRIDADLKNDIYTLGRNELILNKFPISFDGSVSFVGEEDINLVLSFSTADNNFKNFLSLIPAIYKTEFEQIKTQGKFSLNGNIKGIYNVNNLPSFNLNLSVVDASIQYPELPAAIKNINALCKISNKGGDADNTIIDLSKMSLTMGNNPFSASLKLSNPISDPLINAKADGNIKLAEIKNFYPTEQELKGSLKFNMEFGGKMSDLENENYEDFTALGFLLAKNVSYNSEELKSPFIIESAQLNFSPEYIDLAEFKSKSGENDIQLSGKVMNYITYYFDKGILTGNVNLNSNYLNIDELLSDEKIKTETSDSLAPTTTTTATDSNETVSGIVEIPAKIKFDATANIKTFVYDDIEMKDLNGVISIDDETMYLKNLTMKAVEGEMMASGFYSSKDQENPNVDLKLTLQNLSIPASYNKFAVIKKYLPLAKKTEGYFDADFNFTSLLDNDMMPVYSSLNGSGNLSTTKIRVKDLNTMLEIAETLKLSDLKQLDIDGFKTSFTFTNGKMTVDPTNFKYKSIKGNLSGWTSFDQSISYDLKLKIPREEFGDEANKLLQSTLDNINSYGTNLNFPDMIPINIGIGGTLQNPQIKSAFNQGNSKSTADKVEEVLKEEIEKKTEEVKEEISKKAEELIKDANQEADAIIKEAEKQAAVLKKNAQDAMNNLEEETEKQAQNLIAEGKKNGFAAELAAKEAAKTLRSESKSQGQELLEKAEENADALIMEAKKTAAKIKADAKKEAEKIK